MLATSTAAFAIRVFVSSTFVDMQAERDLLVNQVFPDIRRRCAALGIDFEAIDLRWGVSGENSDAQVLDYCLDQIDNCLPYLFAMVGGRYGWVPGERPDLAALLDESERACSVTEIEIRRFERSVARAQKEPRMLAALRDPALTAAFGVGELLPAQAAARLDALRTRLAGSPGAFDYAELDTFAERVCAYFMAEAQALAATIDTPARQIDEQQLRYLSLLHVPGVTRVPLALAARMPEDRTASRSEAALDAELERERLHIVLGGPGSGKTMLSAALAARWAGRDPLRQVLKLHVGATGELTLNGVLRDLYRLADAGETEDWAEGLARTLRVQGRPTLIVLDGVERMLGWHQAMPATLEFIAHEPYQLLLTLEALLRAHPDVRLLLTCDPDACPANAFGALLDEPEQALHIDPYGGPALPFLVTRILALDDAARRAVASDFFRFRGKQLTASQLEQIAQAKHIGDFDTLYLACDRLRRFGQLQSDRQHQDAFIAQRIDTLFGQGQAEAIATVVGEARAAPGLDAARIDAVLALLAVARYGLPATDVVALASKLCGREVLLRDWAVIEGMFGPLLVRGATRFQFKNATVLRAVIALLDPSVLQGARAALVDHVLAGIARTGLDGAFAVTVDAVSPSELAWQLAALPGHAGWRHLVDPLTLVTWFARDPEVALIEFNANFKADAFQQAYLDADVDEQAVIARFRAAAASFLAHADAAGAANFERALDWTANALFLPESESSGRALLAARVASCALYAVMQDAWPTLDNAAAAIERTALVLETLHGERGPEAARGSPLRAQLAAWRAGLRSGGRPPEERALERIDFALDSLARRLAQA